MTEKKRTVITIGTFDLVKGIGMISIVIGHMMYDYDVDKMPALLLPLVILHILGYGLMPMFYFASGYGCKEKSVGNILKKSGKDLMIPYLWVMAAVIVFFPLCHYLAFRWWPGAFSEMFRVALAFAVGVPCPGKELFGIRLYECSVVWFLLSLFIAMNVINVILKLHEEWQRVMMVCFCVIAGYWCSVYRIWYFCIPQGLMAVGYLYVGYRIKIDKWLQKSVPMWQYVILAGVSVIEILFGGFHFSYNIFKWGLLDYLGAGCIGLLSLRISVWANCIENAASEAIRKIGRYTYWAMCVHAVEMSCIPWYLFAQKFAKYPHMAFGAEVVLRGMIIGLGCVLLNRISKVKHRKRMEKKYVGKSLA